MAKSAQHSFEGLFAQFFAVALILILLFLAMLTYLIDASFLAIVTLLIIVVLPFCFYGYYVRTAIRAPLLGLSASLEAVRHEDYSMRPHPKFNAGAIKNLSDEVNLMADDLRIRKLHYDQQAVLVLNLIEQLATPIAVFDQNGRLNHGNDAFSAWCGRPWLQAKLLSAQTLGLDFDKPSTSWHILDKEKASHWQLRHSNFSMLGDDYQLVVLTNIEKVVNETQKIAWHKMTRVLSHEINNSLSPIKSLAQSLVDVFAQHGADKSTLQALEVIASRSNNLMQFVNRYASLNQQFDIKLEAVQLAKLVDKVTALFDHKIITHNCEVQVNADPIILEQVLINLIKNAAEASPSDSPITVSAKQSNGTTKIVIEDNGSGITNPDNLFVPFYTTKDNGKGIGLALSRNMIEQHGGRLTLQNKDGEQGAEATISLY